MVKVAGSRCKTTDKGKKKADDTGLARTKSLKRGRLSGSSNFSDPDVWALLDAIEKELPLGERGWKVVQVAYNKYTQEHGHKERSHKSLETKYKQVSLIPCIRTPMTEWCDQFIRKGKPTGRGICPPQIERAFEIEDKINERAGTHDVNDSQLDEPMTDTASLVSERIEISSDEEHDKAVATVKRVSSDQTPVPCRKETMTGVGLMKKIANSLDPSAQHQRDNDRAGHNLSAVQMPHIHTCRQETVTRPNGQVEVIELTDTDSLSSDDNKENHCRGRAPHLTHVTPIRRVRRQNAQMQVSKMSP